jgi:DNA-binding MarR family transcriptional regulator
MKNRLMQAIVFCSPEFTKLSEIACIACPQIGIQQGSFGKLIIQAEAGGFVENKRQGSAKLIRLTEKGRAAKRTARLKDASETDRPSG